ncbi:ABC transporter ATP-binding protein [Bacillus cereus]|uniref:ABC transporter domain-containing protein n=1 Tax=Bacillus cereus HuA2-1 TaxID=1053201 RepID=J8XXV9_BACCE|nr:ABC transporter ATP-binding protein [Bacillus cereus]EJV74123.1 hypothetical protein IG3_05945 [Bacillus cereus HuA2-1]
MDYVIDVDNLVREYESHKGILKREKKIVQAVKGISFKVKKGEIFSLLGPNGAGKTTTIKILTTLLAPTSGDVKVLGYNTFGEEKLLRPHINFIYGGERNLYWRISARENLIYFADLYKVDKVTREKRIPELLELVGLSDRADDKVETYSKGMKQRLQIARGLINSPEILFLDEPTIGLDPIGARDLRDIVKNLANQGKTILITTHYMYEADELSDRTAIINEGKLVALDTPQNLKQIVSGFSVIELEVFGIDQHRFESLKNIQGVEAASLKQKDQIQIIQLQCKNPSDVMNDVMKAIQGITILNINTRNTTLEDVYIKYVGG